MSNYMPKIEDIYRDKTLFIKEMEVYLDNLKKEKENKSMRENVRNFVKMITNGTDVMVAANETGVIEMSTHDLLSEMSVVLAGKQFANTLKSAMKNFLNWVEESNDILDICKCSKASVEDVKELDSAMVEMQKVSENTVNQLNNESCLDVIEIDLKDVGYDFSQWEEDVKPVKAILSICIPSWNDLNTSPYDMKLVGHLIFLMEDGSFRMKQD